MQDLVSKLQGARNEVLLNVLSVDRSKKYIILDLGSMVQNTKRSLHAAWNKYMSHDWIPEEKARRFSVERFYVDLKWTKIEEGVFKNFRKDIRGILDILVEAGKIGINILVEGN